MAKEFNIKQGETATFRVAAKSKVNGNPINLTGASCYLVVKESLDDTSCLASVDTQYFDLTSAASGIAEVTLRDNLTWLDPGRYFVEIKIYVSGKIVKSLDDVFLNIKKSNFVRRLVSVVGEVTAVSSMVGAADII